MQSAVFLSVVLFICQPPDVPSNRPPDVPESPHMPMNVEAVVELPATVNITCPPDAKIWFDGTLTTRTGTERQYQSPQLNGSAYAYEIRAAWRQGGTLVQQTKIVPVKAGKVAIVTFGSEVSRQATFFDRRLRKGEVQHPVDDRLDPQLADLLNGMEPYQPATKTQTTFRRVSGYITPSARSEMPNKWNVPGHLDGVNGWSSRIYKTKGITAPAFLVRQDPFDSVSAVTWGRSYPDVQFVDVLRNTDGNLFEVRVASKHDGQWERFVAYADPIARPHGYVRPTSKDCRACHEQAGRSKYGGSAVPGGDTILSEGLSVLENGGVMQGGNGVSLN